jgi:hypothetical protein
MFLFLSILIVMLLNLDPDSVRSGPRPPRNNFFYSFIVFLNNKIMMC